MTDRVGQQLGNYRLLRLLGRGGFAEVYLGEHAYLNKPAALKILHMRLGEQDAAQFLREAQTLAGLDHPHIVRVLDFAVQDGMPFLIMDYAVGGTLRTRHPAGTRVPLEQIIAYVSQLASALQYAHNQRLIHRDVKPENMLLGAREEVLLGDFGLAMLTPSTRSGSTQAMDPAMAGTAPYLAPEQVQGQPRPASDQYALGVVVYEWLCGQRPFRGAPIEVALQHLSAAPPPIRKQLPELSPAIEEVIMRALAKEPELRFPSVQDFALALGEASREDAYGHMLPVQASGYLAAAGRGAATIPHLTHPHNLPIQPTPFIGREQELATVGDLLQREEVRLLTLTGPGGAGKTRMALQVATELSNLFASGVFFVNLAPISDPALVIPTITETLGIREVGGQPPIERLKEALRQKQTLLLLDNFEQVVNAAEQVAGLLFACPQLKMVVTSREVLHVRAEHEFAVPPLALPDPKRLPDPVALSQFEAVALFVERAQAVKADFQLTTANARAIAEICVRLDGLPLAIELAAARIKLLPPQALLARLEQRLAVLTGGARDVPARQQTLRNTITWSYDLLTPEEQGLFRRLSVFVGGCTLQAAEAVCTALDHGDGAGQVLDGVASLINKSLLQQTEQEGEEPRLLMLETIREYGLECLVASGEMEATRQAHAAYYLRLTEEAEQSLLGAEQVQWLERLEREHDNVRAALSWLIESGELETALRLGGALWRFWWMRGHLSAGRAVLERMLMAPGEVASSIRARALTGAGVLAGEQGNWSQAEAFCGESLRLFRELQDSRGIVTSLWMLGHVAITTGKYAAAHTLGEEALSLSHQADDTWGIATSLEILTSTAHDEGKYEEARARGEEYLTYARKAADTRAIAHALLMLGLVNFSLGDLVRGHTLLTEGLALAKQVGDERNIAYALSYLGMVAFLQGEYAVAPALFEESLVHAGRVGDREAIAWGRFGQGMLAFFQGDYAVARTQLEECLRILRQLDYHNMFLVALCLEGLGCVATTLGEPMWAARLWGKAETVRAVGGPSMPPVVRTIYEQFVSTACTQLDEQAFAGAWAEGRMMTLEHVLAAQGAAMVPGEISSVAQPATTRTLPTYPAGLTAREVDVLRLVAQGLTDAQVAEKLVVSPRTVNWHLTSIYGKLQVSSRSAATRYAIEHHLV